MIANIPFRTAITTKPIIVKGKKLTSMVLNKKTPTTRDIANVTELYASKSFRNLVLYGLKWFANP